MIYLFSINNIYFFYFVDHDASYIGKYILRVSVAVSPESNKLTVASLLNT